MWNSFLGCLSIESGNAMYMKYEIYTSLFWNTPTMEAILSNEIMFGGRVEHNKVAMFTLTMCPGVLPGFLSSVQLDTHVRRAAM